MPQRRNYYKKKIYIKPVSVMNCTVLPPFGVKPVTSNETLRNCNDGFSLMHNKERKERICIMHRKFQQQKKNHYSLV